MKFAENVKKEGIGATVVGTPQSISNGCGLSVRISDLSVGRRTLYLGRYPTFNGIYYINGRGEAINITK